MEDAPKEISGQETWECVIDIARLESGIESIAFKQDSMQWPLKALRSVVQMFVSLVMPYRT